MKQVIRLLACLLLAFTLACDSAQLPAAEIHQVQIEQIGTRYQISFELNTQAFWEVEASDESDDAGAFFTIAQNQPRHKEEGLINTGPVALRIGEDYIIRILAYTKDDLLSGRAAISYAYIDKP